MSRADFVLFRRMRGVFWGMLVIGVVLVPVMLVTGFGIAVNTDAVSEGLRQEMGRPRELMVAGIGLAGFVSVVAAVILGATAGSVDHQRGVLRDLVLAGRARWRVVVGRLVAAAAWLALAMAISFGACVVLALALAPVDADVDWDGVGRTTATFAYGPFYTLPFAAGIALLVGSRGPAIAIYFAIAFVLDGVLGVIPTIGEWWQEVSLLRAGATLEAFIGQPAAELDGAVVQAMAVVVGWAVVPLGLGLARLSRRDL